VEIVVPSRPWIVNVVASVAPVIELVVIVVVAPTSSVPGMVTVWPVRPIVMSLAFVAPMLIVPNVDPEPPPASIVTLPSMPPA
jgi:hypothetical protein